MKKKQLISHWEFITHKGKCASRPDYVTAICENCKEPLFCNPNKFMGTAEDEGTIIFSGFFVGMPENVKQFILKNNAENRQKDLPKYCACCGAEMVED